MASRSVAAAPRRHKPPSLTIAPWLSMKCAMCGCGRSVCCATVATPGSNRTPACSFVDRAGMEWGYLLASRWVRSGARGLAVAEMEHLSGHYGAAAARSCAESAGCKHCSVRMLLMLTRRVSIGQGRSQEGFGCGRSSISNLSHD
jgi:hypothetical protein